MVMKSRQLGQRICGMDDKRIIGGNVNHRYARVDLDKDSGPRKTNYSRPSIVDTYDAPAEQAVWIGILDIRYVPPDFLDTSENGGSK